MICIKPRRRHALLAMALTSVVAGSSVSANPSPYPATAYPVDFEDVKALPVASGAIPHAYGQAPSQYGLLWLPFGGEPVPLVMFIHGDCWLSENGVEHIQPLASTLVRAGYAVWAPEYRRVGEDGGGWPGTFDDLRAALAATATLKPGRIDTTRTVLAGHSAGGHLALWLATREQPLASGVTVIGAVGLAPITNLSTYQALHDESGNRCAGAVSRLLGGGPQTVPGRYREASPALAGDSGLRLQLLHGSADDVVPLAQSRNMPNAGLDVLQGAGHYDLIHPGTQAFPALLRAIETVLSP